MFKEYIQNNDFNYLSTKIIIFIFLSISGAFIIYGILNEEERLFKMLYILAAIVIYLFTKIIEIMMDIEINTRKMLNIEQNTIITNKLLLELCRFNKHIE